MQIPYFDQKKTYIPLKIVQKYLFFFKKKKKNAKKKHLFCIQFLFRVTADQVEQFAGDCLLARFVVFNGQLAY